MLTAQMIRVESTAARPLKTVCSVAILVCLMLAVARPLNGQKPESPSSKPQTNLVSSARPVRVSQSTSQKDWREETGNNSNAPVTIVEFFDYQCPFCLKTNRAVEKAIKNHPGKVHLVLKNLPLSIHPDSALAHQAALAAGEQGRFWEMHDLLFANYNKIKLPDLLHYAQQLHLDVPRFQKALASGRFRHVIEDDRAMARGLGVSSTPTFFINGKSLIGQLSAEKLNAAIDEAIDPENPATVTTDTVSVDNLDLSGAPVRGQTQAAITVIEFSDLQCPFCARVTPTLQELMKQYPGSSPLGV